MTAASTPEVCASVVNTTCNYESTDVGMPVITNASIASAGTIQFTGTDFITTGFTPLVDFGGVTADIVTISSATSAVATWTKGVPVVANATAPILSFSKDSTTDLMTVVHYASGEINITNALEITSASNGLTCSFNGGCEFEVSAKGLSTLLQGDPENNHITVCDRKCIF